MVPGSETVRGLPKGIEQHGLGKNHKSQFEITQIAERERDGEGGEVHHEWEFPTQLYEQEYYRESQVVGKF